MPEYSQEAARKFIAEVREDNGGITAEDRDFLLANRPSALRALQKTRRQLADSIKIVVDNLYSKETRFLYELIQNAEDNSYSTAIANGEEPFLAFKLYPDRIIIDSNEDGFSESNIRAICSVGNSTKKHSAGYIGEKGIGFKSVFKIAQKVHIHSGPFSFAFSHTQEDDDDGLGMITPYYKDAEELPRGVRTRMTLTLLDSTDSEERAAEFREVPDTFLMFLSRLQRLSIELYQPENAPTAIQYSKEEFKEKGLYMTFLAKTTRKGKEESTSQQDYYTMKSDIYNLPFDEARKDKQGNSIDSATVILAFPVDELDEPVIKQQYTYAFLPLRRVGFNFLIQADFVTQANREDVVHSKRNQAVLKGVARAFADAMVVFCKLPSLKYQWMRYLPEDYITDEFWGTLWTMVREKLEQTPLLEPWSGRGLYKPSDLERLSESFIAEDRNPLLPDLEDAEVYLSFKYTEADFQILKRLGTKTLQLSKFLDRLDADLRNPSGSKWRSMNNADWLTRICKLLSRCFMKNHADEHKRLRTLALIPLRDGRWVSSASGTKIYFPKTDDIFIPADLGLNLVRPMAVENVAWQELLSNLGVMSCPQKFVISLIYKRYDSTNLDNFNLYNAVGHIRYLYWFLAKDHSSLAPQVRLANQHGSLLKKGQYLYFPNEGDDYSPTQLFKQDTQLPGHPVNYLHENYLKAVGPEIIHNGRPWTRWLEELVGVRRIPELCAKNHVGLSKEFQYIVDHRSNRLLGTLKRGWAYYRLQIDSVMEGELRNKAVLLENGRRTSLLRTFLPFPKLKRIAAELGITDAYPFIAISELLRDEERLDWTFVKDLQVGIEESLDFYLCVLETFKTVNPTLKTAFARDQLARIYQNLQSRCSDGLDRVRDTFRHRVIWIQPSNRSYSTWLSTADCVWDGPQWLESKRCLKLEPYLELEHLFKVSLKTPDASQIDVVNDLLMLKSDCGEKNPLRSRDTGYTYNPEWSVYKSKAFAGLEDDEIIEEAEKRYDYLWQQYSHPINGENPESQGALCSTFEDSALVYIPKEKAWRPPSQCVWVDSSVKIPEKASIADTYPSKKTFFTTVLKIPKPTVEMYVESLKAEAKEKASTAQVKETMALICRLGIGETDLSSLVEDKVIPVKLANGESSFAAALSKEDFVIMENIIHWDAFKGKITVLDFSLEEIRDTRPLLLALGLEKRFSSKLVKEITDVRGGSQNHEMTRNLRIKSQAIARCAFHFASLSKRQDVASLHRRFKRAIVYVSDGIRRSLQITQRGRCIEGALSRANFHFEEAEGALRLYLPKDEVECDVCFESDLPRRLCTFLGVTDPGAPGIVGAVFRKDNPTVIDRILENAGVGQVDCDFAALDEELGTSEAGSDVETLVHATSNISLSTPSSVPRPCTPSGRARRREGQSGSENAEDVRDKIMPDPSYRGQQREAQETAYKRILEQVVNVAKQRVHSGVFESTGLSVGDPIAIKPLPQETIREAFPLRSQERDFKVGAAGELYMFEYLKGLGLPGFGLENWKSAIRDRVKLHADYHDIEKDNDRRAIADIEYLDESRRVTQFLIQRGHLAQRLFDSEEPLYHIEIKTTTSSDWQEPFFMSKAQERHIQDKRNEDGNSRSSIYIICRIFNLGQGDRTGMHIYLDPETKRRNGELEFSTHSWAVKPLTHPSMPTGNDFARAFATRTTRTAAANAWTSRDTGTNAGEKESKVLNFATFGSSNSTFGSSTPGSQKQAESLGGSLFGSNSVTSGNSAYTQTLPKSSIFGTTQPSSTAGIFFGSSGVSPNSDTSKSLFPGLFGSNATSSNSDVSEATQKGGLFGSGISPNSDTSKPLFPGLFSLNATSSNGDTSEAVPKGSLFGSNSFSANNHTPKASSTGNIFGKLTSSDASKGTSPSTTGSSGFGSFSSSTSNAPSAGSLFGTRAVKSSNGEILKSNSSSSIFGTAESYSSTRGGQFGTNPSLGNAHVPKTTATGIPTAATGSSLGTAAMSTESRPSQSASPFSGFRTSSFTPRGGFGTNATTSTSHDTFGSTEGESADKKRP
ncbi:MAG: hypothetical protein Q9181_002384 [Wetmoreana brouardii]